MSDTTVTGEPLAEKEQVVTQSQEAASVEGPKGEKED